MMTGAFAPAGASIGLLATANLAATNAAQNLALPTPRVGANQLRIENHAADWAYINLGTLTQCNANPATVLASLGVAPGAVEVLSVDNSFTTASIILGSGTGTVRITAGEGI